MRVTSGVNDYWISTVSIDSYDGSVPKGQFSNPFFEEPQSFESLTQLLKMLECTLDLTKQPQAFTNRRSFSNVPGVGGNGPPMKSMGRGRLASFSLCIRFRQNSSWQGNLHWLEEGCRQNFRSALELILLMDSALERAARRQEKAGENTA